MLKSKYLPVLVDISQWQPLPECRYFNEIFPLKTSVFSVFFLVIILLEGQSALIRTEVISGKNSTAVLWVSCAQVSINNLSLYYELVLSKVKIVGRTASYMMNHS